MHRRVDMVWVQNQTSWTAMLARCSTRTVYFAMTTISADECVMGAASAHRSRPPDVNALGALGLGLLSTRVQGLVQGHSRVRYTLLCMRK